MKTVTANEIKLLRSLREKKYRDASGLFVVEGEKMVGEAMESGFGIEAVYRREEVGEKVMERISSLSSPSPVLAVVRRPVAVTPEVGGLCLALDSVRDPGNLGTILRICDWFGIDSVFASEDTVEEFNPKVIQASMGAVFRKTVCYCDLAELCRRFKSSGLKVFGTFLGGVRVRSFNPFHYTINTTAIDRLNQVYIQVRIQQFVLHPLACILIIIF